MSYSFPPEIKTLIAANKATGIYDSENQVLEAALHVFSDYHASVANIRQEISDYEQGKAEPIDEAMADIRRQLDCR